MRGGEETRRVRGETQTARGGKAKEEGTAGRREKERLVKREEEEERGRDKERTRGREEKA